MNQYVRVDRRNGSSGGQLLQHVTDKKKWLLKVFVGRNAKGRKKYSSQVFRGGKREAEALLTELQHQKNQGKLAPRSAATLTDLTQEWLAHKAREVSERTLKGYRRSLESYVLPSLGGRKLAKITLRDIDQLYGHMLEGKLPTPESGAGGWNGKPLSPRTVRLTHAALSQALSQGVRWGMLQFNPANEASLPADKPKERRALNRSERERFLAAARDSSYGILYHLLIDTGLRPGEACGLRWEDVDLERGRLRVQRSVTTGENGPVIAEPKTTKSRRSVPLIRGLRDALLAHRDWQREHGLDGAGFVVTTMDGRMVSPTNMGKRDFVRVVKAAGISNPEEVTPYTLRHTFGTLHLEAATPLKVVSDLMGHATIQQTADTYQHVSTEATEDWMRRFESSVENAAEPRESLPN